MGGNGTFARRSRARTGTRTGTRRRGVLATAIAVVVALLPLTPVSALGDVDQATKPGGGSEPCSASEYPGSKLVTTGESRQSFVPVIPGLSGVELCVQNLVGVTGTDFTLKVYEKGLGANPDKLLATKAKDTGTDLLASQWVRVDLDTVLATTPGTKYVLGVTPTSGTAASVSFQWRSTCDGVLASCDLLYTSDVYPQGETNDLPGNADYGFRTITPKIGDLVASATVSASVCPGLDLTGRATGTVTNASAEAVAPFEAQWLWSSDTAVDAGDRLLGARVAIPSLAAGASSSVKPPTLPTNLPYGPGYLLLQADPGNAVREANDANNVAAPATTVTACAQPNLATLDLAVVEDTVGTGFNEVQFDDLSSSALASLPQTAAETATSPAFQPNGFSPNGFSPNGFSPNAFSSNGFAPNGFSPNGFSPNGFSPNGFSPNGFSPNGFSPNGFSAAGGVLLSTVLDDLPAALVQATHVVDVPIVGAGWESRLPSLNDPADPSKQRPIQDVTLAEASRLLPGLLLDEVDLTRVVTSSWMALALANAPLNSVPIDWCALIASTGTSCAALGVDPATTSLLGLEATGFPTHQAPIAGRTLASTPVDARWLVLGLPLSGNRSFHLGLTDLGQLPADVALTTPSSIVDCAAFDCHRPLVEAQEAGAVRNVTVSALVDGLSSTGRSKVTLGDLAMGTASLGNLRLSAANWNVADATRTDPACPPVHYQLKGTNTGAGAAIDPTATVTLPPGFAYVARSVSLTDDGVAGPAQPEPSSTVAADGTRTLTFALDADIASSFTLAFTACANEYLGSFAVGAARVSGLGISGPYERTTTSTDRVRVTERVPHGGTRAVANADNVVIADHIASAGEYDSWSFPVKTEPGTLYVVKLFPPAGTDYDLLAFGPGSSSLSFNPNGFSPNGFSPNGFSPNAFSPNAFSPNGFSPNGFSPNGFSPNGFSPNGFSTTTAPDLNDDLPIRELQPAGSFGVAVSANRGDTPEALYLMGRSGDAGNLTFSVADYNGTHSDAPYFLTIQTVRPTVNPALAACATAPWDLTKPAGAAPTAWSGTTPPKTIFVANSQVTSSAFPADAAAGLSALQTLAARPEVRGIVLNVDSDPDVRAAYAGWRSKWCDPTAANVVATQIRRKVLALRQQYPTIDTIVLAGGDPIIPDFRLDDRSPLANETQYTDALLRAARTNNPTVATYANGMVPSSDPYGNEGALPFGMSYAFPPSAGVSRLVETPTDWVAQRDQYVLANGSLDPASAFVSAYDGMVDGAKAAASALEGANVRTTLLTDEGRSPWTAAEFRAGAFTSGSRFGGWNGHANHFGLLSDDGSTRNDATEQITTAESASIPQGAFVFTNGCHFGTAIDDLVNAAPTAAERTRLKDWAQAISSRKGIAVANTGFGIFDTLEVGQGERLQQYFTEEMPRSSNVSLALARAKNRFFAGPGVYDAYTYKTMHQLTMYGLGVFKLFGASADPAPQPRPAATTEIPVKAGPYTVDTTGTSGCTSCYRLQATPAGTKIELRDASVETGHTSSMGTASIPTSLRTIRLPQGKLPAGLWINGLTSATLQDQDIVHTRLAVDDPSREVEPQNAGPFPTAISTINAIGGTAHVGLLHGIAVPERKVGAGKVAGDVHLYTSLDASLRLRDDTTQGCRPTISSVTATQAPGSDRIALDVLAKETCGANTRAAVLGRLSNGTWVYAEAVKTAGHWLTGIQLPSGTTLEDLLAEVANGVDVSYWRFKGDRPVINQGRTDPNLQIVTGTATASGIYRSTVTAKVVGTAGTSYDVYDKDVFVGTFANGSTFTISGDGPHEVAAFGSDGTKAGKLVVIDTTAPTVAWRTPATTTATYRTGDVVRLDVQCADASGATCSRTVGTTAVANGALLDTAKATTSAVTITVKATDAVGNVTTESRTYTVQSRYVISPFASPILAKPSLNVVSPASNIALKFTVTANGVEQTDPTIITGRTWQPINCTSKAASGTVFAATGTNPEYSGGFHFNVSAPSPLGCYVLTVQLVDGATQTAYFQVKR